MDAEQQCNRLAEESSPYLRQHAHNPVDWFPWGAEAIERARNEDKPIFLSIGYSACHWCHVMAHESFEDEHTAAILNAHFVSIKVDREERPDLDDIYMTAAQIQNGQGGWPLSVFLTPALEPFFAGTYYPPEDRHGLPGFKSVLQAVRRAWNDERDRIDDSAREMTALVAHSMKAHDGDGQVSEALLERAQVQLMADFDAAEGGFGGAPKFPPSMALELLMRRYVRDDDGRILQCVMLTLDKMARGGLYDHLGGGFHRYSTDGRWLVPHFEKMLYDNAQLATVYLAAFQLTERKSYRNIAQDTLTYLLRDMQAPGGAFYSAEDADSEGQEGAFYLWREQEIDAILDPKDAFLFRACYNVRHEGNFSSHEPYHAGRNILHMTDPPEQVAQRLGIGAEELNARLSQARATLLRTRGQRTRPGRDDKILAAWNGLAITALARGAQVLEEPRFAEAAARAARFVIDAMCDGQDLYHSYCQNQLGPAGFLEDYACVANALVDLYETDYDPAWLEEAQRLADRMETLFWDEDRATFCATRAGQADTLVRSERALDSATPSGVSIAAEVLLRLAALLDRPGLRRRAEALLKGRGAELERAPLAHVKLLCAVDRLLHPGKEVALVGTPGDDDFRQLQRILHRACLPNRIVAAIDPEDARADWARELVPLLQMRSAIGGRATAYVCENYTCRKPATSPGILEQQLRGE